MRGAAPSRCSKPAPSSAVPGTRRIITRRLPPCAAAAPGAPAALSDETALLAQNPLKYGLEGRQRFGGDVYRAPVWREDGVIILTTVKSITDLLANDGYRCDAAYG